MQHVDDGTLHAWLDRQVTDSAEAAWIETHLRECATCSARLAEERMTLQNAEALLASVAPAADSSRAAFDALVAAAGASPGSGSDPVDGPRSRLWTWVMPVGWAASIALAVGLGWAIRDRATPVAEVSRATDTSSQTAAHQAPSSPEVGQQGQANGGQTGLIAPAPAPASQGSQSTLRSQGQSAAGSREPSPGRGEGRGQGQTRGESALAQPKASERAQADSEVPAPAPAQTFTLRGALGESETGGVAINLNPASPVTGAAAVAAAPPAAPPTAPTTTAPANPAQEAAFTLSQELAVLDRAQQPADARGALSAPAPPAPGAAGGAPAGGGGGGGGGGRGARAGAGGGRGGGGGGRGGGGRGAAADAGWRSLPRTEAAAQSGMALYGIDGLMPAATMLSADNMSVRTLYRLESGETVELVQRRAAAPAAARGAAANASTPTFRSGTETQPAGAAAPATWTTVRDEMQLTLQGTADLAALGGRLRLE